MMKHTLVLLLALLCVFPCAYAQATRSAAASQAWVSNYVAKVLGASVPVLEAGVTITEADGYKTYSVTTEDGKTQKIVIEMATDWGLQAQNATLAANNKGVTNGTIFVWNGEGQYVSRAGKIEATKTNYVFDGVASTRDGAVDRFGGLFDVVGIRLQPSISAAITNKVEVAK